MLAAVSTLRFGPEALADPGYFPAKGNALAKWAFEVADQLTTEWTITMTIHKKGIRTTQNTKGICRRPICQREFLYATRRLYTIIRRFPWALPSSRFR